MSNLFASFDLALYLWSSGLVCLLLYNFLNSSWKLSQSSFAFFGLEKFLVSFFMSLKPCGFTKSLALLLSSVFIFIHTVNFVSVLPFNFPMTSQMSFVLSLALFMWGGIIMVEILKNAWGFLSHCIPEGCPLGLACFLFAIEMVSTVIRPITLTVRLLANILAGHLLMILLAKVVSFLPLAFFFFMVLNLVEIGVAAMQAYIFVTMVSLYYTEV